MFKLVKSSLVTLATVCMIVPQQYCAAADQAAPAKATVPDVKLIDGALVGHVITGEGQPVATTVTLSRGDVVVASANSRVDGSYKIEGLKTGLYTISTDAGAANVRLWSAAAPPSARESLPLAQGPIVRGQLGGGLLGFLMNPLVLTGIIITSIAVPVAINNADDGPSSP